MGKRKKAEGLQEYIRDNSTWIPFCGCWFWDLYWDTGGYGQSHQFKEAKAHRLSYRAFKGEVSKGLFVLHRCDTRPCGNPDHLFLGTQKDNISDALQKRRMPFGDRNGSRLHPEKRPRGRTHFSQTHPEKLARGDKNGSRTHPERLARGERHGSHLHPEKFKTPWNKGKTL